MYRYARSVLHIHYSYSGIHCVVTYRLCTGKGSGNYPVLTYRLCPRKIPAKLSGTSAIDYLRHLIGLSNYIVYGMFILEDYFLTVYYFSKSFSDYQAVLVSQH